MASNSIAARKKKPENLVCHLPHSPCPELQRHQEILSSYFGLSEEEEMAKNLYAGENVRHRARAEWGIGKITSIDSCGTVKVVFEGNKIFSIAKGINFLIKVDKHGKRI